MQNDFDQRNCYTGAETPITLERPGLSVPLPEQLIKEFRDLFPQMKKRQIFFGGHPVSITRQSSQQIFSLDANFQSPFLVCQKSDGVRYLLVIARVFKENIVRELYEDEQTATQCYFVSRKGQTALDSYVVDIGISHDTDFPKGSFSGQDRRFVVQILDGQLVYQHKAKKPYFKFLIFDCLVHLGKNICSLPLYKRLELIQRFLHCNNMLGVPPHKIPIQLKDFFRLTNRKFNVPEFLLKKYISHIEHENDGLIFNHDLKQYVIGTTNPGYIKWKPEHLNTVDFMVMPNIKLDGYFEKRIIDLYTARFDQELGRYTRQFYAFMVVHPDKFDQFNDVVEMREQQKIDKMVEAEQDYTQVNQFEGSYIVQCNFQNLESREDRKLLQELIGETKEGIRQILMKQGEQNMDYEAIRQLKQKFLSKNWKIYKPREDKSIPNNTEVVKKIQTSINDGITSKFIIQKGKQINLKAAH